MNSVWVANRDVRGQIFLVSIPVISFFICPGPSTGAFNFSGFRLGPGKVLFFSPGPGPGRQTIFPHFFASDLKNSAILVFGLI